MINSVKMDEPTWKTIKSKIIDEYGTTILMIRDKCRRKLGFTVRYHEEWQRPNGGRWIKVITVYLDFFDDALKVMFFLKYSDILGSK